MKKIIDIDTSTLNIQECQIEKEPEPKEDNMDNLNQIMEIMNSDDYEEKDK